MGGNLPFIPGVYQPNSTIAELILKAGQERARSQERLGQTISDSLLNIGAAAQQGFAQRQRTQNEQKIQGAVSAGIASPDSFETALQALPPEIRTQARKEYSDASDAAARIAERHAKTAQDQAMTLKARHDLEQKNMDDMGTIAFRAQGHASDDDGGLSAMLAATHALKSKGVIGAENFDGPLQNLVANWQKAVASNDPTQIKAAADQNRAAGKATFDHILMNVSPERMQLLRNEQTKPLVLKEGDIAFDPITGKKLLEGGPKPKTLDQQIAEAQPGSPAYREAMTKKAQEAAATRDPLAAAALASNRASLDQSRKDARTDRSYQFNKGELDKLAKPLMDQNDNLAKLDEVVTQRTPQADALIAPAMLKLMVGGQGSGVRITKGEIEAVTGGRSGFENLKAAFEHWNPDSGKALSITEAQRGQIQQLMALAKERIAGKVNAINEANRALVDAGNVEDHRKILSGLQLTLNGAPLSVTSIAKE